MTDTKFIACLESLYFYNEYMITDFAMDPENFDNLRYADLNVIKSLFFVLSILPEDMVISSMCRIERDNIVLAWDELTVTFSFTHFEYNFFKEFKRKLITEDNLLELISIYDTLHNGEY